MHRDDINIVQERILISVEMRKRKEKSDLEQSRFEQNMFINNPEMFEAYSEKKKEEEENGGPIVWTAPQTIEEARELEKIFAEIGEATEKHRDKAADDEFVRQVSMMGMFDGIDINQIGGE